MAVAKGRSLLVQIETATDSYSDLGGLQARSFQINNSEIDSTISPAALTSALWQTSLGGIKQLSVSGTIRCVNEQAERKLWDEAFTEAAQVGLQIVLPPAESNQTHANAIYGATFTGDFTITSLGMSGDLTSAVAMEISLVSNGTITVTNPTDPGP